MSTSSRSRSRSKPGSYVSAGRVATANARRSLLGLSLSRRALALATARKSPTWLRAPLIAVEDHRRWTPEQYFPTLRTTSGAPARTVVASTHARRTSRASSWRLPAVVAFRAPASVLTCVRRSRRRETLFAMRRVGAGKSIYTKPRRNWSSSISCRG